MVEKNFQAAKKHETKEVSGFAFIAFCQSSVPKQPGEQTLDLPAAFVAAERAAIRPARRAPAPNGRDELYSLACEFRFELRAVVRAVTDEPFRRVVRKRSR